MKRKRILQFFIVLFTLGSLLGHGVFGAQKVDAFMDYEVARVHIAIDGSLEARRKHRGLENAVKVDFPDGRGYVRAHYNSDSPTVILTLSYNRSDDLPTLDVTQRATTDGHYKFSSYGSDFNGYVTVVLDIDGDKSSMPKDYIVGSDPMIDSEENMNEEEISTIPRIQGKDRYETAALISSDAYQSADTVVIANAMNFADALSGVPLAYQNQAPILLAHGTKMKASIISEIDRLGANKAIILGGEAAISSEIAQELKVLGLTTQRLAGDDRFETSALIAEELTSVKASSSAVVVDGMEFADAMSIAPIAARKGMPIYLTKSKSLSNAENLKDYTDTYIIGGENAVSKKVESLLSNVTRLHGLDRYETNRKVLEHFGIASSDIYAATGLNFADALSGSVLAAENNTVVALVKGGVHSELISFLESESIRSLTIIGGEAAVSNRVANIFQKKLGL